MEDIFKKLQKMSLNTPFYGIKENPSVRKSTDVNDCNKGFIK